MTLIIPSAHTYRLLVVKEQNKTFVLVADLSSAAKNVIMNYLTTFCQAFFKNIFNLFLKPICINQINSRYRTWPRLAYIKEN